MTFQPVQYSQQDPKWRDEGLGFGEAGETLGAAGCALTCAAMLLSGHGMHETPKSLNERLKKAGGFAGACLRWEALARIHPEAVLKSNVSCATTDAPLAQIDASLAAGQPVIVMVDSSPAPGLTTHWVLLYAREAGDYLMLDPWPAASEAKPRALLLPRYSQGKPLRRSIMHAVIFECFAPGAGAARESDTVTTVIPSRSRAYARVRDEAAAGLNIRSAIETSDPSNIVATVPAGTLLALLEPDGAAKVGAVNQWVRVCDADDNEGFAAAWHLEKARPAAAPAPSRPAAAPAPLPPPELPGGEKQRLVVAVKSAGARLYKEASAKSQLISKEKAGARLVVVEPLEKALPKIGRTGRWLLVKGANNKRGYVDGGLVKEG